MKVEIYINGQRRFGWNVEDDTQAIWNVEERTKHREAKTTQLLAELIPDIQRAFKPDSYEVFIYFPSKMNDQI